jgi:hypothetical protein
MTNARDFTSRYICREAILFLRFICWWTVFALATAVLCGRDLNPLPAPENVVVTSIVAWLTAFSPLGPLAHCINWARLRVLW